MAVASSPDGEILPIAVHRLRASENEQSVTLSAAEGSSGRKGKRPDPPRLKMRGVPDCGMVSSTSSAGYERAIPQSARSFDSLALAQDDTYFRLCISQSPIFPVDAPRPLL